MSPRIPDTASDRKFFLNSNFAHEAHGQPPTRTIVLEFNEPCSGLASNFMDLDFLPRFRTVYERSTVFATDTGEAPPDLEPRMQSPAVHSGTTYAHHGIFHLGDGYKLPEESVAALLSDAGIPVGVFGSMNVDYGKFPAA